jgi:hypothetical protein
MAVPQRVDRGEYDHSEGAGDFTANSTRRAERPALGVADRDGTIRPASSANARRTTADRSDLAERDITRNVRVSNMPGSRRQDRTGGYPTTDELFREEYAKAGLQPATLGDVRVKSGETEQMPDQVIMPETGEEVMAQQFQAEQAAQWQRAVAWDTARRKILAKKKALSLAKNTAAQAKATTVTIGIWSWAFPLWLFVQLPLAILGVAAILFAVVIDSIVQSLSVAKPDDGFLLSAAKFVNREVLEALKSIGSFTNEYILKQFDIDLTLLDPTNIFLALYLFLFAFGLIMIFAIYLIYKLSFLNPLSGAGSGLKIGMFLLALAGYALPILNLLPWFFPWTLVVLRFPK